MIMSNEKNNIFGKNVNTGTNYGHIGDKIEGVQPRIFTENDLENLLQEINIFMSQHGNLVKNDQIVVGIPGDAESTNYGNQIGNALLRSGYKNVIIQGMITTILKPGNYYFDIDFDGGLLIMVCKIPNLR